MTAADPAESAVAVAVAVPAARRPTCPRCKRPRVVCWCEHVSVLPTRTRILLLQHPREQRTGVGTARMAHVALPHSDLRVGLDFAGDAVVSDAIAATDPAYLLFPGPQAVDVGTLPRDRPVTIVVLDGTWWQARKLLTLNPALAALPRVAFTPRAPSAYRIREQPAPFCVSTIEALAEVLTVLEPGGGPFARLLDPFHAMVARQEWFETAVQSRRHRRPARLPRPTARDLLRARLAPIWDRLLCVHGEANAWPRRDPQWQPAEIVHWVATRPSTGERFEAVVAPRRPLAPSTTKHVGVSQDRLDGGVTVPQWQRDWNAFVRPDDVVVSWGRYYRDLATTEGLRLPEPVIDLRAEVARALDRRGGTVEDTAVHLGVAEAALALPDRAGRRLAALLAVLDSFRR